MLSEDTNPYKGSHNSNCEDTVFRQLSCLVWLYLRPITTGLNAHTDQRMLCPSSDCELSGSSSCTNLERLKNLHLQS